MEASPGKVRFSRFGQGVSAHSLSSVLNDKMNLIFIGLRRQGQDTPLTHRFSRIEAEVDQSLIQLGYVDQESDVRGVEPASDRDVFRKQSAKTVSEISEQSVRLND